MILKQIRFSNFQSFGPEPTTIELESCTILIGSNGTGKSAVLQALCRAFGYNPNQRRIRRADFHVPVNEIPSSDPVSKKLWIEFNFEFPEALSNGENSGTIPPNFSHMTICDANSVPYMLIRLEASLASDNEIEETVSYVLEQDENSEPLKTERMNSQDRKNIVVHYIPSQKDPQDQLFESSSALLTKFLKSIDWQMQRDDIQSLSNQITEKMQSNSAVQTLESILTSSWQQIHTGNMFSSPKITFDSTEFDSLIKNLAIMFAPAHDTNSVKSTLLSDGQKSIFYITMILTMIKISRKLKTGELQGIRTQIFRSPIFTIIALEEPENSLSIHYLGRIINQLTILVGEDTQALISTHSPNILSRVKPEQIRYLRLNDLRVTTINSIALPARSDEAYKYIREAVIAFPELYFSKCVLLGEGPSEEIVFRRLLNSIGQNPDDIAVSIVPLGGRHVNHMWRLLDNLQIPYITVLDLDLSRHQGGWGRIEYAMKQIQLLSNQSFKNYQQEITEIPEWDSSRPTFEVNQDNLLFRLEEDNVYFSEPLDLDFALLTSYSEAYNTSSAELTTAKENDIVSVLGQSHGKRSFYSAKELSYFSAYHSKFNNKSKVVSHLNALSVLTDTELIDNLPEYLVRVLDRIRDLLQRSGD